jgi:hypothetical protein
VSDRSDTWWNFSSASCQIARPCPCVRSYSTSARPGYILALSVPALSVMGAGGEHSRVALGNADSWVADVRISATILGGCIRRGNSTNDQLLVRNVLADFVRRQKQAHSSEESPRLLNVGYEPIYLQKANRAIQQAGLASSVQLHCCSIFESGLSRRLLPRVDADAHGGGAGTGRCAD